MSPDEPRSVGALLSVRDAARIKGVSYSAALRAVRSGRLPATRIGRIALIARDDLTRWQPGRAVAATGDAAAQPQVTDRPPTDPLAEVMTRPAAARTVGLLPLLADALGATDAVLRVADATGQVFVPRTWTGTVRPADLVLAEFTDWPGGLRAGLRPAERRPDDDGRLEWLAPVRVAGRLVGIVTATLSATRDLDDGATTRATLLVACLVATMSDERSGQTLAERVRFFQSLVDPGVEAAVATGTGELTDATPAFLRRFGLADGAIGSRIDLVGLIEVYEAIDEMGGAKRSVARRLREALDDGETVTLPWSRTFGGGDGAVAAGPSLRIAVTPLSGTGGGVSQSSVVRLVGVTGSGGTTSVEGDRA